MCGILGLLLQSHGSHASMQLYEGLSLLQHRGQDAAGMVTCGPKGRFYQCKGNGMVRDVFSSLCNGQKTLIGNMGIAHVRYPTAGTSADAEAQPFYVNSPYGIVLAHNGNLTNADSLRRFLDEQVHRHINTDSDSEVLLNIFAHYLHQPDKCRIEETDIVSALRSLFAQVQGAYACVAMIAGYGIVGFRDPYGIRPLSFGIRASPENPHILNTMIASESIVLDALGFSSLRDIQPGEALIVTKQQSFRYQVTEARLPSPCLFEYVYFARPDSIIDGISVHEARLAMGRSLARRIMSTHAHLQIDVIVPVPDTSRTAAQELAMVLGIPFREGFIKNRYVGRTFIMPGQEERKLSVRRKLHPIVSEFSNRHVLIVDDSIVRGTTSKEIVIMARDSGAKKVYVASCAPPIRYPNVYGIDMPSFEELVAYGKDGEEDVAREIGADVVIYQTLEDLVASCTSQRLDIAQFEDSVFTGKYITGDVGLELLNELNMKRKKSRQQNSLKNQLSALPRSCGSDYQTEEEIKADMIGLLNHS